jgi:hypothetical protein
MRGSLLQCSYVFFGVISGPSVRQTERNLLLVSSAHSFPKLELDEWRMASGRGRLDRARLAIQESIARI